MDPSRLPEPLSMESKRLHFLIARTVALGFRALEGELQDSSPERFALGPCGREKKTSEVGVKRGREEPEIETKFTRGGSGGEEEGCWS